MTRSSSSSSVTPLIFSFVAGAVASLVLKSIIDDKRKPKRPINAGATIEGNDLSLFYGNIKELTTITAERRFLPSEVYGNLVRHAVVCCVDILLVRINSHTKQKEFLLVERSTEPVKGVWWLPGGRLLKGETFFDAAVRKAQQETGISQVKPIQVLGVWNTFFPTSYWDDETSKGTQTVNPIVLVEMTEPDADVKLDHTSENFRWIPLDPQQAVNEDKYVQQALLRLQEWNPHYNAL